MRKIIILAVSLACILSFAVPACCGCACGNCNRSGISNSNQTDLNPTYGNSALRKLGRGIANAGTFIFEVPFQMGRINEYDGPFAAATWGLLKGVGMAGVRAAVGVYEVATFPLPMPSGYKPILTDPEFFFEDQTW